MPRWYSLPQQTKSDSPCLSCGDGGADLNKSLTSSFLLLKVYSQCTGLEREMGLGVAHPVRILIHSDISCNDSLSVKK